MNKKIIGIALLTAGALVLAGAANIARANHSWGGYHWSRAANPFTLQTIDSVTAVWDAYLTEAKDDWSSSSAIDIAIEQGSTSVNERRQCRSVAGKIRACNYAYGNNGWLGLAQVWVAGSHITKATTKINDTYFATQTYNTPAWRRLVMCQEIAHDFGLDHQDEGFSNPNLGTCMDYTSNPAGPPSNEHPNQHDYDQLELIYAHLDGASSSPTPWWNGLFGKRPMLASSPDGTLDREALQEWRDEMQDWGKELRRDARNRTSLYARDVNKNEKIFTFVIWAE